MNKRLFLKNLGLSATLLPAFAMTIPVEKKRQTKRLPSPLQKGDTVGLISPSAATADRMQFTFATEAMEALGLKVRLGKNLQNRRGHLAGTDQERADDLNGMIVDPDVKAIVCLRGGSGAARILPLIDYEGIRKNPKPLIGYSDITALHCALYAQTGLISFHGPNGSGSWNSFHVEQFERLFFERECLKYENLHVQTDDLVVKTNRIQTLRPGSAEGRILGGNLTVLTALSGTPYYPDFEDAILYIEDIAEDPYRIDRMLSTLKLNGTLDKIRGFIFGQCTDCTPGSGYGSLTLDQVLDDYILPLQIPAYSGAMIGHISKQFIIPNGALVEMNASLGTFELIEDVFN